MDCTIGYCGRLINAYSAPEGTSAVKVLTYSPISHSAAVMNTALQQCTLLVMCLWGLAAAVQAC